MTFKAKIIGGKIARNVWISQESEYKRMKRNKMLVGDKIL